MPEMPDTRSLRERLPVREQGMAGARRGRELSTKKSHGKERDGVRQVQSVWRGLQVWGKLQIQARLQAVRGPTLGLEMQDTRPWSKRGGPRQRPVITGEGRAAQSRTMLACMASGRDAVYMLYAIYRYFVILCKRRKLHI